MAEQQEYEMATNVRPDPKDPRDKPYVADDQGIAGVPVSVGNESYKKLADETWNQRGEECTGFALAAIANYSIRQKDPEASSVSRRMLYEAAQIYDGQDFAEGSTLRGALKGWKKLGVAADELWPYDPDDEHGEKYGTVTLARVLDGGKRPLLSYWTLDTSDIAAMKHAIARGYALYAAARIHVGWNRLYLPEEEPVIHQRPDDKMKGGHAFVIVGYNERGFWVHNSWGPKWGDDGYALLPYEDWAVNAQDAWVVRAELRPDFETKEDENLPKEPTAAKAKATYGRMWRHVVPLGDDGRLSTAGIYGTYAEAVGTLLYLFREQTKDWRRRRLAIFADGGYSAVPATLERLHPMWKFLMEQEIYPIFLVWETPWYSEMQTEIEAFMVRNGALLPDPMGSTPSHESGGPEATTDGAEEDFFEQWRLARPTQAKLAAAESAALTAWTEIGNRSHLAVGATDGGAHILAKAIIYNRDKFPFDIHLIAHGAGDLLLSELALHLPTPIASCHLWAPATTMRQFRDRYQPMLDDGCLRQMTVTALSPAAEKADAMGRLPFSFLTLVANVLAFGDIDLEAAVAEDEGEWRWLLQPQPVLGLEEYLRDDPAIVRLQAAGSLEVSIAEGTHIALAADAALLDATVPRITTGPDMEGPSEEPAADAGRTDQVPAGPGPILTTDPLVRVAGVD